MAVAIEDTAVTGIEADGTSITANTPGSAASGQLLVAFVALDGTPTDIAMSGWTKVSDETGTDGSTSVTVAVFYLHLSSSPSATYDVTWTNSEQGRCTILAISGHNSSSPVNVSQDSNSASADPWTPTGVTTTVDGCLVLACVALDRRTIDVTPSTNETTLTKTDSPNSLNVTSGISYQTKATAGATTQDSWGTPSSDQWAGIVLAIAPAAAGGTAGGIMLMLDHFNGGVAI